ncbi:M23 family metallopeptidase [Paenibacillus popilliae]|uniref:M23 family metallopeptidase n=1 Tax=Paenibacillus popilliae TaxID=78057 RepID=A0ABY3ASY7_PAEPP|nr:M23 family metallopeptidase [Paenibacillus sp. SDF0028]TQR44217.1 M23 family metallopeptidase [Paenibacillus sp. SDF0028]
MNRVIRLALAMFLLSSSTIYAEDASVLLRMYGVAVNDAAKEGKKLNKMEEAYHAAAYQVNANAMLALAAGLHDANQQSMLKEMDLELYALSDTLNETITAMEQSKDQEVEDILALDAKYRSISNDLKAKQQLRKDWVAQYVHTYEVPAQDMAQGEQELKSLENKVEQQRERVRQATTYPELGEVTTFKSPLEVPVVMTSPFGVRLDPVTREAMTFHRGMDFSAPEGTAVLSVFHGVVEEASSNYAVGNYVKINHGHGITTLYGHLSSLGVVPGQKVAQYDEIAKSGNTGAQTTGPHLHLGLFIRGEAVDPGKFITHE